MSVKKTQGKQTETETAKKTPKPGELPKLFKEYEAADQELRVLEQSLEALIIKRSEAVRSIGEFGAGPYDYKGKLLTVTSRKNEEAFKKALEGVETPTADQTAEATRKATRFFFKSTGEQNITKVA